MITIARYSNMVEAQEDASRLAKRDIRVSLVHGGTGFTIAGVDSAIELQVDPRDMEKLEALEEEVAKEIQSEGKYECPLCKSKNYTVRQSFLEVLFSVFRVIHEDRPAVDDKLHLRCRDCRHDFEVRVGE